MAPQVTKSTGTPLMRPSSRSSRGEDASGKRARPTRTRSATTAPTMKWKPQAVWASRGLSAKASWATAYTIP